MSTVSPCLDEATMGLFAQQIRDVIGGVCAIAIHEFNGETAWDERPRTSGAIRPDSPYVRDGVPGKGFCERLENGNSVCVFYLYADDQETASATLAAQVRSNDPLSFELLYRHIKPILRRIEQHMRISFDLSAVRQVSGERRQTA